MAIACVKSFGYVSLKVLCSKLPISFHVCHTCALSAGVGSYHWSIVARWANISSSGSRYFSQYARGVLLAKARLSPPWRMIFFGTDEYALSHLKTLNENRTSGKIKLVDTLEVVVPRSKCAVYEYAQQSGLKVYEWPLSGLPGEYDVGVVVSFGHLIPKRVINIFPYGILNVHPSILPRWRGSSPIIHTILNGDIETGISIMEIRPLHFDVGPLLLQAKFAVPENCTTFQLRDYLIDEGCTMLLQALKDLPSLENLEYEQDEYGVTYACKLSALNARVDWERQTAKDIDRQYRALSEVFGLRSMWRGQPVRLIDMVPPIEMLATDIKDVLDSKFPEQLMTVRPGIAFYLDGREILCIHCKDGWVGFRGIIMRKPMSAKCFYNGYLSKRELRATAFQSLQNNLENLIFKMPAATSTARLRMNGVACSTSSNFLYPSLALANIRS